MKKILLPLALAIGLLALSPLPAAFADDEQAPAATTQDSQPAADNPPAQDQPPATVPDSNDQPPAADTPSNDDSQAPSKDQPSAPPPSDDSSAPSADQPAADTPPPSDDAPAPVVTQSLRVDNSDAPDTTVTVQTTVATVSDPQTIVIKEKGFKLILTQDGDDASGKFRVRLDDVHAKGTFSQTSTGGGNSHIVVDAKINGQVVHQEFDLVNGQVVGITGCIACGGTGNSGLLSGLGNASTTSGNNNAGLLNGNCNAGINDGNGNVGIGNGDCNGVGSSGYMNGSNDGNGNWGNGNGSGNGRHSKGKWNGSNDGNGNKGNLNGSLDGNYSVGSGNGTDDGNFNHGDRNGSFDGNHNKGLKHKGSGLGNGNDGDDEGSWGSSIYPEWFDGYYFDDQPAWMCKKWYDLDVPLKFKWLADKARAKHARLMLLGCKWWWEDPKNPLYNPKQALLFVGTTKHVGG